jgi:hypothetical protein
MTNEEQGQVLYVKLEAAKPIIRAISDELGPGQWVKVAEEINKFILQFLIEYEFTMADVTTYHAMGGSPKFNEMVQQVVTKVKTQLALVSQQGKLKGARRKW